MQTKVIERYFFFGLLLATFIFTFFIFRPFWVVLVLGASFSVLLYPLYSWFTRKRLPEGLASILTVILFMILVCGPLLGIGLMVFNQSQEIYTSISEGNTVAPFLTSIETNINQLLPADMQVDLNTRATEFISYISENMAAILKATFSAVFSFILILLAMFYFLKDGARWKKAIVILSPLDDNDDEKIMTRLGHSVNTVMKGYLLIALAQGLLMGIGMYIFGVPHAAVWGLVAAIASMIPTVGTALVSVPAILFLFYTGHTGGAVGLLVWSVILVSTIDNFLTPLFVGGRINIPPLLVLFSVLGGVALLGPVGVLVGPLAVSLLYTLISIYRNEIRQASF